MVTNEPDKFLRIKCSMKWFFKSENAGNEQKTSWSFSEHEQACSSTYAAAF